jgi:hypothetical protein
MQSALTRYLKSRKSRLIDSPSAYQVLASELLQALASDDAAHTALLTYTSSRYRAQQLAARAATIHAVAMLEGKEWQHDIDAQLTNWLLEQAGLADMEGKIASLAEAVARESELGMGLYVFAKGVLEIRQDTEDGDEG